MDKDIFNINERKDGDEFDALLEEFIRNEYAEQSAGPGQEGASPERDASPDGPPFSGPDAPRDGMSGTDGDTSAEQEESPDRFGFPDGAEVAGLRVLRVVSPFPDLEDPDRDIERMFTSSGALLFDVAVRAAACDAATEDVSKGITLEAEEFDGIAADDDDSEAAPRMVEADFGVDVYAEDFTLVASGEVSTCRRRGEVAWKVSLEAPLRLPLIPGRYEAIFKAGYRAVARFRFEFDDAMLLKGKAASVPIQNNSEECEVMSSLGSRDELWADLCFCPGASALRHKVMELRNRLTVNEKRVSLGLKALPYDQNFVLFCDYDIMADMAICDFIGLVDVSKRGKMLIRRDGESLLPPPNSLNPMDEVDNLLSGQNVPRLLYGLRALADSSGRQVVKRLAQSRGVSFILAGPQSEVDGFLSLYPEFASLFPKENRLQMSEFGVYDLLVCFKRQLVDMELHPSPDAEDHLVRSALEAAKRGILKKFDYEMIQDFVRKSLRQRYETRLLDAYDPGDEVDRDEYATVKVADIDTDSLFDDRSGGFRESMAALDSLVGLNSVKAHFNTMFSRIRVERMRREKGLKTGGDNICHMIFTGNPGTGKTTVAGLLGRIFFSLGIISRGNVVKVERKDIVGRFIGDTEKNMSDILKEARGNVLFIDEAYQLFTGEAGEKKDYGNRALETLLTVLTEKDPDMVVILAGYGDQMDSLLDSNPGLRDRFPFKFHFEDYTSEELLEIADRINGENDYFFDDEAAVRFGEIVMRRVAEKASMKGYSNARWVGTLLRKEIYPAQNERIISLPEADLTEDSLRRITAVDVGKGYSEFLRHENLQNPRRVSKIGFK